MEKKTWCGWRKQKKNGSFFVGLVFLSFFFVSPSVFHLPLQRVRVLQGRQANNGDQETTNSVDSTQKKKNKDKNVRTDGEGWWWWWFVLRRRRRQRQGKQKKGKTVGSGGCGGQLSGRVWSAYWFFLKKWTTNVRSCGEETRGMVPSFCRRSAARPLVCGGDTSKRTSFVSGFAFLLERAEGGVSG